MNWTHEAVYDALVKLGHRTKTDSKIDIYVVLYEPQPRGRALASL